MSNDAFQATVPALLVGVFVMVLVLYWRMP